MNNKVQSAKKKTIIVFLLWSKHIRSSSVSQKCCVYFIITITHQIWAFTWLGTLGVVKYEDCLESVSLTISSKVDTSYRKTAGFCGGLYLHQTVHMLIIFPSFFLTFIVTVLNNLPLSLFTVFFLPFSDWQLLLRLDPPASVPLAL